MAPATMAELTPKERLQPSLLDRLEDDEPERRLEARENRVLTLEKLQECVIRDLGWLLNTENLEAVHELADHPDAAASTINYGIPSLSGKVLEQIDETDLEVTIRESIARFEPRLLKSSIQVQASLDRSQMAQNHLSFQIQAMLWAQPLPLQLFVNAEVDLETGDFRVKAV